VTNEQPDTKPPAPRAPSRPPVPSWLKDASKPGIADLHDIAAHLREAPDQPARVFFAALLGACFVSILALLAVPHLDTPLQVALYMLVIAIPFLLIAILSRSAEYTSGMSEDNELFTTGFQRYGRPVGNLVGTPAAVVGITAVVGHLSAGAAIVGWLALLVRVPSDWRVNEARRSKAATG
jgi:hypothetical protein